jgi:GxxExxY protein
LKISEKEYNQISSKIIACSIEVHRELGPGPLESVYETCLMDELENQNVNARQQVNLPIIYKGKELNKDFFIDILFEDLVIIELKAVEIILPVHEVQLLTYLKLADKKLGLLINFNVQVLKNGIRRKINGFL